VFASYWELADSCRQAGLSVASANEISLLLRPAFVLSVRLDRAEEWAVRYLLDAGADRCRSILGLYGRHPRLMRSPMTTLSSLIVSSTWVVGATL
jgi:hypothetical protein